MFTGGGTGGHVFPGLAILDRVRERGFDVAWIGGRSGMEREIVERASVAFHGIPTGKFRRYLSLRNIVDVFRVVAGVFASILLVAKLRPAMLFSKGGFVSVPPVFAARLLGVPVVSHESDADPGLATRINARFSARICVAYEATLGHFGPGTRERVSVTGNPLRPEIFSGTREAGIARLGFDPGDPRPIVMFLGGSLGARQINETVGELRGPLRPAWRIVHQSGNNGVPPEADEGYFGAPFFGEELPALLAAADVLVCRAGASTIWEGAALAKPMLLVPLVVGSRGDQIRNAEIFARAGGAKVFAEAERLVEDLREELEGPASDSEQRARMGLRARSAIRLDATESIVEIIVNFAEEHQ